MKIVSVLGARPQFIKAAPLQVLFQSRGITTFLLHTGQHYDYQLSQVFFNELNLPAPDVNLNIGSGSHAQQTGQMLIGIETVLKSEQPDYVVVYGDTNSTLAGALSAAKLNIPIAHIEAGLRSYNRSMPEEHNRVLTDHCSDLLFCPTQTALENLASEGIRKGVHLVGDIMLDTTLKFIEVARNTSNILALLGLKSKEFLLLTIHRAYNTGDQAALHDILGALGKINDVVVFPAHPRTLAAMTQYGVKPPTNVRVVEPVGYLDMLRLESAARFILTDSGGLQKESYFLSIPCITLRPETEWVETVQSGWNVLTGSDPQAILHAIHHHPQPAVPPQPVFGDGHAAEKICTVLVDAGAVR